MLIHFYEGEIVGFYTIVYLIKWQKEEKGFSFLVAKISPYMTLVSQQCHNRVHISHMFDNFYIENLLSAVSDCKYFMTLKLLIFLFLHTRDIVVSIRGLYLSLFHNRIDFNSSDIFLQKIKLFSQSWNFAVH